MDASAAPAPSRSQGPSRAARPAALGPQQD